MDWLRIFTPRAWLQNYPTSLELDKKINSLLDSGEKLIRISPYNAKLGDMRLWVENYPYAYCNYRGKLPKLTTRRRISDMLNEYIK
jgi:hypothetical protein